MTQRSWRCEDGDHKRCAGIVCRCFCHLFDRGIYSLGAGIKYAFQKVIMNGVYAPLRGAWPVRSITHLKRISKLRSDYDARIRDLNARHGEEMKTERAQLENLLPRLIKVAGGYQRDKFSGRFTVTTALSEDFVYQILSGYARDNRAMDYVAENMAHELVRQIRTIDFSRTRAMAEFDNYHRESVSWMNPDGMNFPPR